MEAWSSFACAQHRDQLVVSRELLDRDREVLADWRARDQDALNGRGWRKPEPLAIGATARQLVARAEQHGAPPSEAGRGV